MAVLGICMLESLDKHWTKGIMLGVVLMIVFLLLRPANNIYTNASASVLAFAGVSSLYRIFKSSHVSGIKNKLRSSGPHIVHLGIAVLLIGVLMSANAPDPQNVLFMKLNEKKTVAGYEIQLVDLAFPVKHKHATAVMTKIGEYNIYKNGVLLYSGEARFREIKGQYITEPLIYRGLFADVIVRYQGIGTQSPIFISVANVKVVPGMTILWTGSVLVVIGIVPLLFWRRTEGKERSDQ
jgi:cytochrome c biogenesis factor